MTTAVPPNDLRPETLAAALAAVRASIAGQLAEIVERFSLSAFERDVLAMCAGAELDASYAASIARAQRGRGAPGPTFGLALATLDDPHWSALAPTAALRRWRLIDMQPRAGVTSALLRIDERILHFLTGITYLDPRIRGIVEPVEGVAELPASHVGAVHTIMASWLGTQALGAKPVVMLQGRDAVVHQAAVATAAASLGLGLHRMVASSIPIVPDERAELARLWEREAMLLRSALLVVLDTDAPADVRDRARAFVRETSGLVALSANVPVETGERASVVLSIDPPNAEEQAAIWRRELGDRAAELNGAVERVAAQFRLDSAGIRRAVRETLTTSTDDLAGTLWRACRKQLRPALDDLAQRIEPRAMWDDLVLPQPQLAVLRTIVAQVRHRARVADEWGFARKSDRGLGVHTLFAGPSGTGKTMAAEVIANELALDLYHIDLSGVVSKYVGETEKNLRRVFDAAERAGAILLFDEADALFGKRSEVRDSHDRYANIEVSFLLQRCESYRGLAILTTNLKAAIDPAFARRLRFLVNFPFPDQAQRLEIWRRVFPPEMPREGLQLEKLARLSLSGGHIRNVALNAAFLAADAGEPVRMRHLALAVQAEHAKLERPLSEADLAGWT